MAKGAKSTWSLRRKLILAALAIVIVLGLALGLGLGLTIGRNGGDDGNDNGNEPTPTGSPLPTPTGRLAWTPSVNDTWQIVLQNNIELADDASSVTPNVSVFDIDLFTTPKETIDTLHRLGKKVLCYWSGGSYEPYRPDSNQFQQDDFGKALDGWPDEKWLKLGNDNVRKIMKGRVELSAQKGCDAVDVDNVDGYQNDNGLNLTEQDSIDFLTYLSSLTVPLNMSLGLKNAGDIIPVVLPIVQFSVNEQCVQNQECATFQPFIAAGKPVFHIEYPDHAGEKLKEDVVSGYCGDTGNAAGSQGFQTVLKRMDLDGWVEYCDQSVVTTAMNGTDSGN